MNFNSNHLSKPTVRVRFVHVLQRVEAAQKVQVSDVFAEPQIVNDVRHINAVRLVLGRVRGDVKVARRFVDEEGRLEIAAFLIVDFGFDCVVQKAHFVSAALVLNVQADILAGQPRQRDVQVNVELARVAHTVDLLHEQLAHDLGRQVGGELADQQDDD